MMTARPGEGAQLPDPSDRLDLIGSDPPHPSTIDPTSLLSQCELRTQRRSGPGGQHRNKTSSGVFLTHQPTGISGEATERRSQADNRGVALNRLRLNLAVAVRTTSAFDEPPTGDEAILRSKYHGDPLRLGARNEDRPAVLALILNDLHAVGGQPSLVAGLWQSTSSGIVRLLKTQRSAFELVNSIRRHHQRRPLK